MNDSLLTIKELSIWLNVPVSTLRKWYARGDLPHYSLNRHIRFDKYKVMKFLANNEIKTRRRIEIG